MTPDKYGSSEKYSGCRPFSGFHTNYAAMISSPLYHGNKLKFIQLSKVDEHQVLAVIVVEGNMIKPSSTPARAGLLTGLSPWHHGLLGYGKVSPEYKSSMA